MLKFGEVCASAKVKRIRPTTKSIANIYSWGGYFRRSPGMKAPITMTGKTWDIHKLEHEACQAIDE